MLMTSFEYAYNSRLDYFVSWQDLPHGMLKGGEASTNHCSLSQGFPMPRTLRTARAGQRERRVIKVGVG